MTSRSTRRLLLGTLLLFALAAPSAADPLFSSASFFNTGLYPRSVAIADLDGDGHLDLVTANQAGNTVSVLLGNGDGTFRARTDFEAGGAPLSVAIADLNADGLSDLAVSGEGYGPDYTGKVSVLLGNGDGTFGNRTQYGVPQWPQAVAIADMNGDRRPDLVVPSGNPTNKLSVLLGNGDGTFGPGTAFGTSDFPSSVAIADLNGDQRLDVAVTNLNSYSVSVFLGNGDGTLGVGNNFSAGVGPWWVAIADVNGDGSLDLVVANFDSNSVSVLLGNGDGTFGGRRDFGVGESPRALAVADVNGDGFLDVAVANANSYTLSLLLGDGAGGFVDQADFATGYHPNSVAISDVNSDGQPDAMVANTGSSTVSVFLHHAPPPQVQFDFSPSTLELSSRGRWVTGYLEPASPFAASDIDIASIRLNDRAPVDPAAPTALGDHDGDGVTDLMVKFDRAAVELTVSEGDSIPVTITGTVKDKPFSGNDVIRVRRGKISAPAAGAHLAAGSATQLRWQTPSSATVESVTLLHSLDGGSTWQPIARGQPNTGSYEWTVPSVRTDQAKLAVVVESGDLVDGVLAVSDAFAIEAIVGVGDRGPAQLVLAIRGVTPNPAAGGRLRVVFALRDGSPAKLELLDVAGRVLRTRQVGSLGPGTHALDPSEGRAIGPGIYFVRLTQGGSEVRARAALLR